MFSSGTNVYPIKGFYCSATYSVCIPDLLIDEVRDEPGAGDTACLVVAPVASLEVEDESREEQLAHVWELGVHLGSSARVYHYQDQGYHETC